MEDAVDVTTSSDSDVEVTIEAGDAAFDAEKECSKGPTASVIVVLCFIFIPSCTL